MSTATAIPISDARAHLPDLVDRVHRYLDRVVISVSGTPKAALVSTEELESLEETAKIMTIPHIKGDIARSRAQIKKGQYVPLSKLT